MNRKNSRLLGGLGAAAMCFGSFGAAASPFTGGKTSPEERIGMIREVLQTRIPKEKAREKVDDALTNVLDRLNDDDGLVE